jgi:carbon storage regulator
LLVITRQKGQIIRIGDDIEIMVVEVEGDRVRIGINAPRSITILRGELVEDAICENREAAQTAILPEEMGKLLKKNAKYGIIKEKKEPE